MHCAHQSISKRHGISGDNHEDEQRGVRDSHLGSFLGASSWVTWPWYAVGKSRCSLAKLFQWKVFSLMTSGTSGMKGFGGNGNPREHLLHAGLTKAEPKPVSRIGLKDLSENRDLCPKDQAAKAIYS